MTTVAPSVEERAERTDAPLGGGGRVLLAVVLALLALTMAASAILGPLVLGLLRYRTSPTTLTQLEGSDAGVSSWTSRDEILTALLAARRRPCRAALRGRDRGLHPVHLRPGHRRAGVPAPARERRAGSSRSCWRCSCWRKQPSCWAGGSCPRSLPSSGDASTASRPSPCSWWQCSWS